MFPCYNKYSWIYWQNIILRENKGIVIIDKNTGYRYITVKHDIYNFAICDVFGKIHTEISPLNFCFEDADAEFQFLNQLRKNGYYYNDGDIFYEKNKEQKNIKKETCNDNRIISCYCIKNRFKKLVMANKQ